MSESEAIQLLDQATHSGSPRELDTGFALVDIMIAIGAQSCKSNPSTIQAEQFFFARGQQRAFVGMLENPSIDLVRLFLLMSFYMLGACRRNAAFMYLGVASRAAVALGLHSPDSSGLSTPGDQQQRFATDQ